MIKVAEKLNIDSNGEHIEFKINDTGKKLDVKVLQVKSAKTTINELVNQKYVSGNFEALVDEDRICFDVGRGTYKGSFDN